MEFLVVPAYIFLKSQSLTVSSEESIMDTDTTTTLKSVTSGTHLTSIGIVKAVVGLVKAIDESGAERVLQAGDKVYANETIVTSADGIVMVEFQDGTHLDLPNSTHIVLVADIYTPKASV